MLSNASCREQINTYRWEVRAENMCATTEDLKEMNIEGVVPVSLIRRHRKKWVHGTESLTIWNLQELSGAVTYR